MKRLCSCLIWLCPAASTQQIASDWIALPVDRHVIEAIRKSYPCTLSVTALELNAVCFLKNITNAKLAIPSLSDRATEQTHP